MAPPLVDIREDNLLALSAQVVDTLLRDHTTGKNIFWATHDYEALGSEYDYRSEILPHLITGEHGTVIRPRVLKTKGQQTDRVKDMAEVFTPSWVVKMMVDYVDIDIHTRCLELTCGEAPFLVSRYDATTGNPIAIDERVGILDRKLRLINDQQPTDENWLDLVRQAFQSTYGYEWQGDSLLLARENLLRTFVEHYVKRFACMPDMPLLLDFAEIISWNLWQMDGLTYRIPREKSDSQPQAQLSFFNEAPIEAPAPLCIIKDWEKGEVIKVNDIKRRQTKNQDIMKFDVIIGNPPYQDETIGDNDTFAPPIYHLFIDEAYKSGKIVELIHPARFLFNAGSTPKAWNKKMLSDTHFKVLEYKAEVSKVFPNMNINGGITVTYHDNSQEYGPIEVFAQFEELNKIRRNVTSKQDFKSFSDIVTSAYAYHLTEEVYKDHPEVKGRLSKGHDYDLKSNILELMPEVFTYAKVNEDDLLVWGRENNQRATKWVKRCYITGPSNMDKYKVFLAGADGAAGTIGKPIPARIIGVPGLGSAFSAATESFISIGSFDTEEEAKNLIKYLKSKFARAMVSILKVTQAITPEKWKFVPLQDFTPSSDIDWSKSIEEIDEQLFDKYGLDEQERNFIRTKVKEMA
ncbi:MAG: Eco57I restriction-modification methylase domain-containing protein [Bacteroidaceae bacterium]|nr:Eco57I restriction-modification methylase domain-containing protein [Bacteroidaceae bacterium]